MRPRVCTRTVTWAAWRACGACARVRRAGDSCAHAGAYVSGGASLLGVTPELALGKKMSRVLASPATMARHRSSRPSSRVSSVKSLASRRVLAAGVGMGELNCNCNRNPATPRVLAHGPGAARRPTPVSEFVYAPEAEKTRRAPDQTTSYCWSPEEEFSSSLRTKTNTILKFKIYFTKNTTLT